MRSSNGPYPLCGGDSAVEDDSNVPEAVKNHIKKEVGGVTFST